MQALFLILRVLAMMAVLAPHHQEHDAVAVAIAAAALEAEPLYQDDVDRTKTASVMVAVAFREGSFRPHVIGDKGASYGTWQTHLPNKAKTREGWSGELLLDDTQAAARVALRMIRESFKSARYCDGVELGLYIAGPGCASERSKRISTDRMNLARYVRAHAAVMP